MDNLRLLIDFGSTFTKVVLVDINSSEIISRAQHPSTVDSDITTGLRECLNRISSDSGIDDISAIEALACSSAAGGLRIVCVGFVPEYSMKAANLAALGAGAKVVGCFSYEITKREIEQISDLKPDIILLTGGTDGGDKKVILHNAGMLAGREWPGISIIIAGNRTASDEIDTIFKDKKIKFYFTDNVMPDVNRLDVDSCNNKIREIFIVSIIEAKGIAKAKALIKNVLMPTPSAVLEAAKLLSEGYKDISGFGELMIIDVGGATTDVHSVANGKSTRGITVKVGLPEPYAKRTVEGDLGLKHNIDKLVDLGREKGYPADVEKVVDKFSNGNFPCNEQEIDYHVMLSKLAVETAVMRHVGRIESKYGPMGEMLVQYGKDFSEIKCVIGTGGPIIFSEDPGEILKGALFREEMPDELKPKSPKLFLDMNYILYGGGLLSVYEQQKALLFMKKNIKELS